MSETDYAKLGLKVGIEIHQQLDTEHKLFCRCKARFSEARPEKEIARKLRVVAGETGEIDVAALGEVAKGTEFVYRVYPEETCLIELDEEPPGKMNMEALDIVLTIAGLLRCEVSEEIHVMRKTVLDGSNTSGFQRTAVVGLRGKMSTENFGEVGIENICLEEESAQILMRRMERGEETIPGRVITDDYPKKIWYGLDRLGIPLVEIGTSPDIRSPEQAHEVAEKLGMIVRSTDRVKRGLGTIRQDINVSIADGARVEIKGAQELRLIPKFVENEAMRQANLLRIRDELKKKGFKPVKPKVMHISHIFKDSQSRITRDKTTYAILIPDFAGFLKRNLTPTRTLGKEIADYVKVRSELRGFIHSDEELEKYQLTKEFVKLRHEMRAHKSDTLIIAVGEKEAVEKTMKVVAESINQLVIGVPKEVRRALESGDSEYMRPLPGSARLYPETDVPPIRITQKKLAEIQKNLPELLEERGRKITMHLTEKLQIADNASVKKLKISGEILNQIIKSGKHKLFEKLIDAGYAPKIVSTTLISTLPYLKRSGVTVEKLEERHFAAVFDKLKAGEIAKEAIPDILKAFAAEPELAIENAIRKTKIVALTLDDLRAIIRKTIEKNRELAGDERGEKILLGLIMQVVRGKINPQIVMGELEKELKKARAK